MATKAKKTTNTARKEAKEIFEKKFLLYYLGILDGSTFNNATRSWLMAKGYTSQQIKDLSAPEIVNVETEEEMIDSDGNKHKIMRKRKVYTPVYETAKTNSNDLLTKTHIVKLRKEILDDMLKDIEGIKRRHLELAQQNKNLPVSRQANADLLKVFGALEDKQSIDIPQLNELTNKISDILKPKKK